MVIPSYVQALMITKHVTVHFRRAYKPGVIGILANNTPWQFIHILEIQIAGLI